MKISALMAEKCNSLSHFVNIVYIAVFVLCIVLYLVCIMYVFDLLSVYHCVNNQSIIFILINHIQRYREDINIHITNTK